MFLDRDTIINLAVDTTKHYSIRIMGKHCEMQMSRFREAVEQTDNIMDALDVLRDEGAIIKEDDIQGMLQDTHLEWLNDMRVPVTSEPPQMTITFTT
jgi:hypothetical protein